ncbi:MAG TPA: alpha/beta fold hydrolase [Acidobacteriaceae bacterium]|nr:alpha/beta fold hydrolase [Acidobacteriaceae bacterium]
MTIRDWVVCPKKKSDASIRLFCFPYAGGGCSAFRSWVEEAGHDLELCFLQYPGRENRIREQPIARLAELVPLLASGMTSWLDRPFGFYGHSLGGRIAFETARELRRRRSRGPACLFVGASHAPQLRWPYPPLHAMDEGPFLEGMQERYGGVPKQILDDPEMRALLIPTLRADVAMLETYAYTAEPPLDCDITVFGGNTDRTVERPALEAWKDQTRGAFRFHALSGGHFFLQTARRELLSTIQADLSLNPLITSESR